MRRIVLASLLGLGLFGGALATADGAFAGCGLFSGTADAVGKPEAVRRAQEAVREAIDNWKSSKGVRSVSISPARARPQPYWRESVSAELFVRPDVVTGTSHTICWRGVVSPFVCTAGARVCY